MSDTASSASSTSSPSPAPPVSSVPSGSNSLPRVLVVDDSRMVRATIVKLIKGKYDVCEAGDGEAGWESLFADDSIQVVISDLTMPRLDGYGLMQRIRASNVARIRETPVIMISGEENEAARLRAKECGATDFITKGIGTAELLSRLDAQVMLAQTSRQLVESREVIAQTAAVDPASGLITRSNLERQCDQMLSHARRHQGEVSALLIGFDMFDDLVAKHGVAVGEQLLGQFAKIMHKAVRREDCLARHGAAEFAIVSPSATFKSSTTFAVRLRDAIGNATVNYRGETLHFAVSIGIASSVADSTDTSQELLGVALKRMTEARADGGNCVVGESPANATAEPAYTLEQALALARAKDAEALRPQLKKLGARLLPLLELLESEYQLGLPLDEMRQALIAD